MPPEAALFPGFSDLFLRRLSLLRFRPRPGIPGKGAGEHLVRKGGASVEFSDFRTYSYGDDFRLVDWNSYARLDRLFVKVFRDEEGFVLHLLLDRSRSMDWGQPNKLLFARRLAAALGYIALSAYNWATIQTLPDEWSFPEHRGRRMIPELFRFLRDLPTGGACELGTVLAEYARQHRQPGLLVILSDALSPRGIEGGINRLLALGHQLVFLHLLAPDEITPTRAGEFELVDSEWGDRLEVSLDRFSLRTFAIFFERWRRSLQDYCQSRGVLYFLLPTTLSVEEAVLHRLLQRGLLQA
ncbi:MAG: DUF58 domain-containing protein [Coprothermobacterota bacterium]|nr:DUF58 domain-containing protein [Coprothermobacterota bacterium]